MSILLNLSVSGLVFHKCKLVFSARLLYKMDTLFNCLIVWDSLTLKSHIDSDHLNSECLLKSIWYIYSRVKCSLTITLRYHDNFRQILIPLILAILFNCAEKVIYDSLEICWILNITTLKHFNISCGVKNMQRFYSNSYTNYIPIFTLHFPLPGKLLLGLLAITGNL